jgi:hypothetical protein
VLASTPRRRSVPSLASLVTACLASGILVLNLFPSLAAALTGGLAATPASAAGRLLVEESDAAGSTRCLSAPAETAGGAVCSSANPFGGAEVLAPGRPHTTTLVFTNTGSVPVSSFAVDAGDCSQVRSGRHGASVTDLCDLFSVRLTVAGATIFEGSAAEFGRVGAIDVAGKAGIGPLASGDSISVTLTLRLSEAVDNRYQGLRIATPISWSFGA